MLHFILIICFLQPSKMAATPFRYFIFAAVRRDAPRQISPAMPDFPILRHFRRGFRYMRFEYCLRCSPFLTTVMLSSLVSGCFCLHFFFFFFDIFCHAILYFVFAVCALILPPPRGRSADTIYRRHDASRFFFFQALLR